MENFILLAQAQELAQAQAQASAAASTELSYRESEYTTFTKLAVEGTFESFGCAIAPSSEAGLVGVRITCADAENAAWFVDMVHNMCAPPFAADQAAAAPGRRPAQAAGSGAT